MIFSINHYPTINSVEINLSDLFSQQSPSAPPRTGSKRLASPTSPDDSLPAKTRRGAPVADTSGSNSNSSPTKTERITEKATRSSTRHHTTPPSSKTSPAATSPPTTGKGRRTSKRVASVAASPSNSTISVHSEDESIASTASSSVSKSSNHENSKTSPSSKTRADSLTPKGTARRSSRGTTTTTIAIDNGSNNNGTRRSSRQNTSFTDSENGSISTTPPTAAALETKTLSSSNKKKKAVTVTATLKAGKQKREHPATSSEEESPQIGEKVNKSSRLTKMNAKKRRIITNNAEEDDDDGELEKKIINTDLEPNNQLKTRKNNRQSIIEKNGIEAAEVKEILPKSPSENSANELENNTTDKRKTKNSLYNNSVTKNGQPEVQAPESERRSRRGRGMTVSTDVSVNKDTVSNRAESAKRRLSNGSASDSSSPEKKCEPNRCNKRIRIVSHINGIEQSAENGDCQSISQKVLDSDFSKDSGKSLINDEECQVDHLGSAGINIKSPLASDGETTLISAKTEATDTNTSTPATTAMAVDDDVVSDAEQLLMDFGLKDKQAREVISLLSEEYRGQIFINSLTFLLILHTKGVDFIPPPILFTSTQQSYRLLGLFPARFWAESHAAGLRLMLLG